MRCTAVSIVHIPKLLVMYWLVVSNISYFSIYWELTFIFFRGVETTNQFIYIYICISKVNSLYDIYIKIIGPLETPFSQVQIPDLGRDVLRTHCSFSCDAGSFTGAKQDRLFFRTAGCSFRRTVDVGHRGTRWQAEATTCSQQVAKHEIWVEGRPTFMTFLPFEIDLWGSPKDENVFPGC